MRGIISVTLIISFLSLSYHTATYTDLTQASAQKRGKWRVHLRIYTLA